MRSRSVWLAMVVGLVAFGAGLGLAPVWSGGLAFGQATTAQDEEGLPDDVRAWLFAGAPGERHRELDRMIGEWRLDLKLWLAPGEEPVVGTGTTRRDWILDGRFVRSRVEVETPVGELEGLGFFGYDVFDGQFEEVWLENQATAIETSAGRLNPETGQLTFHGTMRDPATGLLISTRRVMDVSDGDRHTITGYSTSEDGIEVRVFEVVLTRQQ